MEFMEKVKNLMNLIDIDVILKPMRDDLLRSRKEFEISIENYQKEVSIVEKNIEREIKKRNLMIVKSKAAIEKLKRKRNDAVLKGNMSLAENIEDDIEKASSEIKKFESKIRLMNESLIHGTEEMFQVVCLKFKEYYSLTNNLENKRVEIFLLLRDLEAKLSATQHRLNSNINAFNFTPSASKKMIEINELHNGKIDTGNAKGNFEIGIAKEKYIINKFAR